MTNKLDWSEKYCVEKFLPLLTKWHFQENVPRRSIKPTTIKKKRNPRGERPTLQCVGHMIDLHDAWCTFCFLFWSLFITYLITILPIFRYIKWA